MRCVDLKRFLAARGRRYHDCRITSFKFHGNKEEMARQRRVVKRLSTFTDDMPAAMETGGGLLLSGPVGTGKDHFLVALARVAICRYGYSVRWISGMDLCGAFRDQITIGATEREELAKYRTPDILIISDPLPIWGSLTEYQAGVLYRIIDYRVNNLRPTWCSFNCTGEPEAVKRLGAATVDRLRDGAVTIACDWPSYRKPQNEKSE